MKSKKKKIKPFSLNTLATLRSRYEYLRDKTTQETGRGEKFAEKLRARTCHLYAGLALGIEQLAVKTSPSDEEVLLFVKAEKLQKEIFFTTKRQAA